MKRLLVSTALAAALYACGSVEGETGKDTEAILGEDASVPNVEVSNVGSACDAALACEGVAAQCLTRSSTATTYVDGYCTASCSADAECGPGGVCPVGEAERAAPDYDFMDSWPRKCFRSCVPGVVGACREGYRCLSLAEAYRRTEAPLPLRAPVCIPTGSSSDGDDGSDASVGLGGSVDSPKH